MFVKEFINSNLNKELSTQEEPIVIRVDLNLESFRITFSSKKLLENVVNQANSTYNNVKIPSFIHLYGTYKLLLNGFIVLFVGTEDINHHFSPISVTCSS